MNYYISKKTANTTEIKGNLTNMIPLDDSLNVSLGSYIFIEFYVINNLLLDAGRA